MSERAAKREPYAFDDVPDQYKMCKRAVQINPGLLEFVPNCYKTHKICKRAVKKSPWSLRFAPD